MESLRISVVLTIYNGEKFLSEQLESILNQSRKPDELLILDDCSTDHSMEIVEQLTKGYNDIEIKMIINSCNLGWKANFIQGFHLASGDLIFCADQDDIWNLDKIEVMSKVLEDREDINVLACNLTPLYEKGATKLADFYINNYGRDYISRVRLKDRGFAVIRPGCTVCFRRIILPWIDKIWNEKLAHDEVIWAVGLSTDSLYIINEPLISFRRHSNNNSPSNKKNINARLERILCNLDKETALLKISDELSIDESKIKYLNDAVFLNNARKDAFTDKSIFKGLLLVRYLSKYNSIKGWLVDLLSIINH